MIGSAAVACSLEGLGLERALGERSAIESPAPRPAPRLSAPAEPAPAPIRAALALAVDGDAAARLVEPASERLAAKPEVDAAAPPPPIDPTAAPEYVEPTLRSIARETYIYGEPGPAAMKIGYLRLGAVVPRSEKPSGHTGCKRGWYGIKPEGYVCVGSTAQLDTDPPHPIADFARVRPDRMAALPYRYGRSLYPTPPLYARLPTRLEQEQSEVELTGHLRRRTERAWSEVPSDALPEGLLGGAALPVPLGYVREGNPVTTGRAMPDSGFALLGIYQHAGRRFALSTDFELLPLDRMKPVEVSRFHGVRLSQHFTLPLVFVRAKNAKLYTGSLEQRILSVARRLEFREALPLSGRELTLAGVRYLELSGGQDFVRDENLVRIEPLKKKPAWALPGRTWIHISILEQSLVMYEGETPIYATLVSTGVDGLGDPAETRSTVRGAFLIHTKHVSSTMDSDAPEDPFDLRDVPYVQYFTGGYALHAAYWHDSFGQPYSHGCINLSPLDARALFHMTSPAVPQAWHGALSLRGGTLVYVSP
jgi:hypothetical protein